jgi:hypothetical protein
VQEDNVMAAMSKVSALMEHFQLYGASIERQLETTIKKLDVITERMPQQLQHSAHGLLGALPPQIVGQVGQHLAPSVKQFEQRLDASMHTLQQGTQAAAEALQTIQRMHRWLIWKMLGITFGCLLLLTAQESHGMTPIVRTACGRSTTGSATTTSRRTCWSTPARKGVRVPPQVIKNGQVVLNLAMRAVANLDLGNEWISFQARFSGVSQASRFRCRPCWRCTRRKTGRA